MPNTKEKLADVHSKLMGLLQRAPYIRCEDVHRQYAVNWLINNGVTVQGDCAELKKAMNRLGQFGRLFVDYQGCPRGRNGRAGVPLEEEVLLIPKITDVDGGEWIPVNADALHELVEQFKKLREISRQTPASVQNVPETNVGEWISVKDERKPKYGEDVLVVVFDGYDTYTDTDCLMRDGKWCFETENHKITHWQQMPQPPKGE